MTLPTNASARAFGSATQCLQNRNEQPADYFTMAPNGWASKPLKCIRVAHQGGGDSQELGVFDYGKLLDRSGRSWDYDRLTDRYKPEGYWRDDGYKKVGEGSGYKYVYVGPWDGRVWGTDPKYRLMGGVVPYGSCYASIMHVG